MKNFFNAKDKLFKYPDGLKTSDWRPAGEISLEQMYKQYGSTDPSTYPMAEKLLREKLQLDPEEKRQIVGYRELRKPDLDYTSYDEDFAADRMQNPDFKYEPIYEEPGGEPSLDSSGPKPTPEIDTERYRQVSKGSHGTVPLYKDMQSGKLMTQKQVTPKYFNGLNLSGGEALSNVGGVSGLLNMGTQLAASSGNEKVAKAAGIVNNLSSIGGTIGNSQQNKTQVLDMRDTPNNKLNRQKMRYGMNY